MNWLKISSAANPAVKELKRLATSPRICRQEEKSIAEGVHLAKEILNRKELVLRIVLREGAEKNQEVSKVLQDLEILNVPCLQLTNHLFNEICPVENSVGIICEIKIPRSSALPRGEDIVFLDGVQDPGNVGTIIRAALASGVRNFASSANCAYFWSPKVLRAAMGAHFQCNFINTKNLAEIKALTGNICLVADARGGKSLYELKWDKRPVLWVFGSEGQGVSDTALEEADYRVFIPINPQVESLNVAMAATVCLFERKRIREAALVSQSTN